MHHKANALADLLGAISSVSSMFACVRAAIPYIAACQFSRQFLDLLALRIVPYSADFLTSSTRSQTTQTARKQSEGQHFGTDEPSVPRGLDLPGFQTRCSKLNTRGSIELMERARDRPANNKTTSPIGPRNCTTGAIEHTGATVFRLLKRFCGPF